MRFLPTGDDAPPPRPLPSYHATARGLGDRLLAIVRRVRVLDAVRWDESVGRDFLAAGGRELPTITPASYLPLPFDPAAKRRDLLDLERETARRLGRGDPLGRLLRRRCRQARDAVELLTLRGTPAFAPLARELYGSPTPADDAAVAAVFTALAEITAPPAARRTIDSESAADHLATRLRSSLAGAGRFRVRLSDTLVSDAAACGRSVKLRRAALFSPADLALLEVHEGWVHVGTTLNARRQPVCNFLVHGPPATTAGQEGLAVLCELLAGVSHAGRVRRLWHRYRAVRLADAGADFRDVYRYFLADSDHPRDAFQQASRLFRGSLPSGAGPFAKDATYALGLVRLLAMPRAALAANLPLLFTGKVGPADLPLLSTLTDVGLLDRPAVLPPLDDAAVALLALPHPPHQLPAPHLSGRRLPVL